MPDNPNIVDPNDPSQVTQTVNTPNLELFNPPPNNWSIVGDVLGRRRGLISALAGGFMSDYGARKSAEKEIPAFEELLKTEGSPLEPEQLKQINQMDPQTALQELSILQAKALKAKAADKQYEPKQMWDPHKNSWVWKRPGEDLSGLQSPGEHARMQVAQLKQGAEGTPTLYKDIREDTLKHGGTIRDAINDYKRYQESLAVQKVVQEGQQKGVGENAKNWSNAQLETPDPTVPYDQLAQLGYRPATPQQQDAGRRLASAYGDVTSSQVQKDLRQVLRATPAATEGAAAWQTFWRNPAVTRLNMWNTNLLQMVNPTFTKTLRVNQQELEMLRRYFIKLPTWKSPTADTIPQAEAKIKGAKQLLQRIMRQAHIDPSQFEGDAGDLSKYDTTDDTTKETGDAALKAAGIGE